MNSATEPVPDLETAGATSGPKKYPTIATASPVALVVYCGDPRFQEPIERFLVEELGLQKGNYVPLVVGGGVASLSVVELPKDVKYMRDAITFYLEHFGTISRVILVSHEDCGKYKAMQKALPLLTAFVKNLSERQLADLRSVTEALLKFAPRHVEVERYYARFANSEHTQVVFEKC